jgi:hypothetical protein
MIVLTVHSDSDLIFGAAHQGIYKRIVQVQMVKEIYRADVIYCTTLDCHRFRRRLPESNDRMLAAD